MAPARKRAAERSNSHAEDLQLGTIDLDRNLRMRAEMKSSDGFPTSDCISNESVTHGFWISGGRLETRCGGFVTSAFHYYSTMHVLTNPDLVNIFCTKSFNCIHAYTRIDAWV